MRLKSVFIASLVLLLVSNCSEKEKIDPEKPVVEFSAASVARLTGVVDLEFKAIDNNSIASIQLYVDGVLVTDQEFSPPANVFTFTWNSETVSEGAHQIKVVVKDATGKTTEQTFDIEVRNILFQVTIPNGYIGAKNKLWLFLSDNAGNLLGVQEAHNNTNVVFGMLPDFTDSTFIVNAFNYFVLPAGDNDFLWRNIQSYTDVKPGIYHYTGADINFFEPYPVLGQVVVNINDISAGYHHVALGSRYNSYSSGDYTSPTSYSVTVQVTKGQSDIMVSMIHNDGGAKYKLLKGVKPGDEVTLSFNAFIDFNKAVLPTPGASYVAVQQAGTLPDNKDDLYFFNDNPNVNGSELINSYYPSEKLFDKYTGFASESVGNISNFYSHYGSSPLTIFKRSAAQLVSHDFSNNRIQINFTGGDAYMMELSSNGNTLQNGENVGDTWHAYMPFKTKTDFKFPAIPAEIVASYYPDGFVSYPFHSISISERLLSELSYNDFFNGVFNYTSSTELTDFEYISKTFSFTEDQGGRMKSVLFDRNFSLSPSHDKFAELLRQMKRR
jgi:hypothetical protein